jgi:hypothetical protein
MGGARDLVISTTLARIREYQSAETCLAQQRRSKMASAQEYSTKKKKAPHGIFTKPSTHQIKKFQLQLDAHPVPYLRSQQ